MLWESATTVCIQIYSAEVEKVLKRLNEHGIVLRNVHKEGELTATVRVGNKDYLYALRVLDQLHVEYNLPDRQQTSALLKKLCSRSVLLISLVILTVISVYLPGKILFVSVIGNDTVPARLIVEVAAKSGVSFGAFSADVRSEKVKNAILQEIPQLQWIGVNTSGCVATICVEEKKSTAGTGNSDYTVSSLVAAYDGIVESCTVTSGTMLCEVGKAVMTGQMLISGYTDCGSFIRATRAEGEVFAQTVRPIYAVCPTSYIAKGNETGREVRYGLRLGKKLINFNNSSGIYHSSCAKIYEEQYLILPGGFVLPVSFVKETVVHYDENSGTIGVNDSEYWLRKSSEAYINSQMIAGEIMCDTALFAQLDGCSQLTGHYICRELISRQRIENILQGET